MEILPACTPRGVGLRVRLNATEDRGTLAPCIDHSQNQWYSSVEMVHSTSWSFLDPREEMKGKEQKKRGGM
jgi:hypothetical protein